MYYYCVYYMCGVDDKYFTREGWKVENMLIVFEVLSLVDIELQVMSHASTGILFP